MKGLQLLLVGAVALTLSAAASAEVLFDNFGPGDSYNTSSGMTLGASGNWQQGNGFLIVGGSYYLDSIEAAIGFVNGQNDVTLMLYDDAGGLPGTPLEHIQLVGQMGGFGQNNPPLVFDFSGATLLQEGAMYYAVASVPVGSWSAWNFNNQGDVGPRAQRQGDGGTWNVIQDNRAAMRVNGTIPGPGALALLALAGLASRRRR